jgi:hypothetical protein
MLVSTEARTTAVLTDVHGSASCAIMPKSKTPTAG